MSSHDFDASFLCEAVPARASLFLREPAAGGAAHQRRLWRRGCGCGLGYIPSTIGPRLPGPWCCLDPSRRRWGVAAKSLPMNPPPTDALPACARAGEKDTRRGSLRL